MNRLTRIFVLCCLCISVLLVCACKKKPDETVPQKYMTGTPVHGIPQYLYVDRSYTFTVSGITDPKEGVSYSWEASNFAPGSCDTRSYTCLTPVDPGTYTIQVNVSCDGYYNIPLSQSVTVIDSTFFGCLAGIIPGNHSIEDPRDGLTYQTRTYGDLEWFVQNLNWAGAGNPYGKIEALGTPYGRLYSWNEASRGVCPPGWHVPTNEEWAHLSTVVNGGAPLSFFDKWDKIADPLCVYAKLNNAYIWPYSPHNTKSNTAAWNGLPGGSSSDHGTHYGNFATFGFWWSASEADENNGYYRYINYDVNQFPYHYTDKDSFGASVRCVRTVVNGD